MLIENIKIPVWIRVFNSIIDGVILFLIFKYYDFGFWLSIFHHHYWIYSFFGSMAYYLYYPLIVFLYYFILESLFNQTLGKFITQTIVLKDDMNKPTIWNIFYRSLFRLLPTNLLFIFSSEDTLIYEEMSGTIAVNKNKLKSYKDLQQRKKDVYFKLKSKKSLDLF